MRRYVLNREDRFKNMDKTVWLTKDKGWMHSRARNALMKRKGSSLVSSGACIDYKYAHFYKLIQTGSQAR